MLRTRVWTALIVLPPLLAVVIWASYRLFTAFIAALTAWGLYEVAEMSADRRLGLVALVAAGGGVPAAALLWSGHPAWLPAAVLIATMLALTVQQAIQGPGEDGSAVMMSLLGSLYVGLLFPYFALIRNQPGGVPLIILMLLIVVAGDTGGYFAGTNLGRHQLLSKVSPGKTLEGSAGSLLASVIAGLALYRFLAPELTPWRILFLAVMVNLAAQAGDLAESAYKRMARVKDSGWLFPGHGGLLDRADSLVFAAVFTYYYNR